MYTCTCTCTVEVNIKLMYRFRCTIVLRMQFHSFRYAVLRYGINRSTLILRCQARLAVNLSKLGRRVPQAEQESKHLLTSKACSSCDDT